jgi:hypothetical protein
VNSNRLKDLRWPIVATFLSLLFVALFVLGVVVFLIDMFEKIGR